MWMPKCLTPLFVVALTIAVVVSDGRTVNDVNLCYVYPTSLDGSVQAATFNVWKRFVLRVAQRSFSNTSFYSRVLENADTTTPVALVERISSMITTFDCTVVIISSPTTIATVPALITTVPLAFPGVRFVAYSVQLSLTPTEVLTSMFPPNVQFIGLSHLVGWYAAGAAAAVECKRCIAFVSPHPQAVDAANAFARGVRWAAKNGFSPATNANRTTSTCPVFHILRDYTSPQTRYGEPLLANLLLKKGCDIIASWSDSELIPSAVAANASFSVPWSDAADAVTNRNHVFSISAFVNTARTLGDSAMVSVLFPIGPLVARAVISIVLNATIRSQFVDGINGSLLSSFSPKVSRAAAQAGRLAFNQQVSSMDFLCGGFQNSTGHWINTSACVTSAEMFTVLESNIDILYNPLSTFRDPSHCEPGTEAQYSLETLELTCSACGSHSFSRGSGICLPCSHGTRAAPNRTYCVAEPSDPGHGVSVVAVIIIVVASSTGILLAYGIFGRLILRRMTAKKQRHRTQPPAGPHLGFVMLCVDNRRTPRTWRQDIDLAESLIDALQDCVLSACSAVDGFVAYQCADVFMIVTDSPTLAFQLATGIVEEYTRLDVSKHLRLKIVVTGGIVSKVSSSSSGSETPKNLHIVIEYPLENTYQSPAAILIAPAEADISTRYIFSGSPLDDALRLIPTSLQGRHSQSRASVLIVSTVVEKDPSLLRHILGSGLQGLTVLEASLSPIDSPRGFVNGTASAANSCGSLLEGDDANINIRASELLSQLELCLNSGADVSWADWIRTNVFKRKRARAITFGDASFRSNGIVHESNSPGARSTSQLRQSKTEEVAARTSAKRTPASPQKKFDTAVTPGVLDVIFFNRFSILSEVEVTVLVLIASSIINRFLAHLDKATSQSVLALASAKLNIRLERLAHRPVGARSGVFRQKSVAELISAELLSVMDERALLEYIQTIEHLRNCDKATV